MQFDYHGLRRLDRGMGGLALGLGGIVLLVLSAELPVEMIDHQPSFCLVRFFGGNWCWGCGITRACWYLLHGDIDGAIAFNRLVIMVAPLLAFLYLRWFARVIRGVLRQK